MKPNVQTWAPCLRCFRGEADANNMLDSADRVQEQTQKQLLQVEVRCYTSV